jgi:ribosomal protein L34E
MHRITPRYHPARSTDKEARSPSSSAVLDGAHHLRHHRSMQTKCAQCGAAMTCQPEGGCWCAELPPVPIPADAKGCLCPDCLRAKIAALHKLDERKEA